MRVELKITSEQGWLLAITVDGRWALKITFDGHWALKEGPRPSDKQTEGKGRSAGE